KHALKENGGFFPADTESAEVLEPGDGAFDGPAFLVSSQWPSVLSLRAITAVGSDHFHSHLRHLLIKHVAVVSFVANQALGDLSGHHEIKESLNQMALVRGRRRAVRGHRQTFAINHNHDFDALSNTGAADPIAAALGFSKGPIHEAFVKLETIALFN